MFKLVVLFSVLAFAVAKPGLVLPLAYNSYPAVSSQSQYSVHGSAIVPAYTADYGLTYPSVVSTGYPVAAWAQPAHSPAVVLDPINGVPLDTPEVVAARAAHFQAKALAGHHLAKRSLTPLTYSTVVPSYAYSPYSRGVVAPVSTLAYSSLSSPLVSSYGPYVTPYGHYSASGIVPKALSVHPY